MSFRVGLMGASLGTGNRGVSALGVSLAKLVWQAQPEAEISLLIGSRSASATEVRINGQTRAVETVNYRFAPVGALGQQLWFILLISWLYRSVPSAAFRKRISHASRWVRCVAEADLVGDIRGGDSFSDIYGTKGFLMASLPVLSVIWIRGRIHLLPQTYGPFQSILARWLARYILLRAESIWCRDRVSLEQVSRLTGWRRRGALCPDVAFALEAEAPAAKPFVRKEDGATLVGLNVSALLWYEGVTMFGLRLDYRVFLKRLVEQLLADRTTRILLVPHLFGGTDGDPSACRDLMQRISPSLLDRLHHVTEERDQHELKGLIGMCDFFIGSRMHACIAALSQGIPTVGVAYSRKFAGVFDIVGSANWVIDGRTACEDEAVRRVGELFAKRDEQRPILRASVAAAQNELSRIFDGIARRRTS